MPRGRQADPTIAVKKAEAERHHLELVSFRYSDFTKVFERLTLQELFMVRGKLMEEISHRKNTISFEENQAVQRVPLGHSTET